MADVNVAYREAQNLLRDKASDNYVAHMSEIARIQRDIERNRNGELPLTEITNDPSRLSKRIAREGMALNKALERINGVPNFQDVSIIRRILRSATSVCRIVLQDKFGISGYGTGFLISPNVLITNNHVLPDTATAASALAQFNYELDEGGRILSPVNFKLRPDHFFLTSTYLKTDDSPFSGRDFTLVAVEPVSTDGGSLDRFGYIQMDETLGKIIEGENCVVIQHPRGDYKKVVLRDIRLITLTENFLIYESDTLPGSSGSVVLGLGTGAVVALHHSAIPRKDASGRWLRKDGSPAQDNDSDEQIDWLGNEGVRVSCIVEAFSNLPIPDSMQALRQQIIDAQTAPIQLPAKPVPMTPLTSPVTTAPDKKPAKATASTLRPRTESAKGVQYFEVLLANQPTLQADWEQRAGSLVEGLLEDTPLIPFSLDPLFVRMRYLTVMSGRNPWELAQAIENLPHVESCKPDLETLTDIGVSEQGTADKASPFESEHIFNDGTATPNEKEFLRDFETAKWVVAAKNVNDKYHRWWNWLAVNCPEDGQRNDAGWQQIRQNLASLRMAQLDTGYSLHSKVFSGFNTDKDFDFIDQDEDARDLMARFLLKQPGHGTRTASLLVGNALVADPQQLDGNGGILTFGGQNPVRLVPYRIAKSVVLIGRGKQMVDAANFAINNQTDVLFMCMGTVPKDMFAAVARRAYDSGVIWVCAAGNEVEVVVAPAVYPGTIAVAAVNPKDEPWSGSSHGSSVDIAAPGEQVYVPFVDKQGNEIMVYGNGTSYATPHVAAAAMLWKARNLDEIENKYHQPWQVVEAFRQTLRSTARRPDNWTPAMFERYGAGVLDIDALLKAKLPDINDDDYIYKEMPTLIPRDLGIAEAAHFIWNIIRRKVTPGSTERMLTTSTLTPRGQMAMAAFTTTPQAMAVESAGLAGTVAADSLLREYFGQ